MPAKLLMTEQEYLAHYADEQPPWEYDNGEVTQKRQMTKRHHTIAAEELSAEFRQYRKATGGFAGQTPTTNFSDLHNRRYRIPDFGYWAPGKPQGDEIFLPPTLAVEIVSPGQSVPQLREKCRFLLSQGVDVCWLIEPEQRWVEVFDAEHDGTRLPENALLQSPYLPGFSMPVRQLWDAIDEQLA